MNQHLSHSLSDAPLASDLSTSGWTRLLIQWRLDMRLALYIFSILAIFRLILTVSFSNLLAESTTYSDLVSAFLMGLRFDASTATAWVLLSVLASLFVLRFQWQKAINRFRSLAFYAFVSVGLITLVFDYFFFQTYNDHFNQMVFGLLYDDTQAILMTVWKEYHPLLVLPLLALIIYLNIRFVQPWLFDNKPVVNSLAQINHGLLKFIAIVFVLAWVLLSMRGYMWYGPPLSLKHVFITSDQALNRMIPNSFFALRKAVSRQQALLDGAGYKRYWPNGGLDSMLQAEAEYSQKSLPDLTQDRVNVDGYFTRSAPGITKTPPKHVFVILMESYSGWPLLPEYRKAGFSEGLADIAEQGLYIKNMLPGTWSTIHSLNVLVSGLPPQHFHVNHHAKALSAYPSAFAHIVKQLGYQTQFFYGGFIGWQRLDSYLPAQGFDTIYGGGDIKTATRVNEWGVDDEYLFDFVQTKVSDDRPSFNFILTTSNHPPYDIDVKKKGFVGKTIPKNIINGQRDALTLLGHHWYADQQAARFIREMKFKYPDSLFIVTGDHPARMQLTFPGDNVFEQQIVPLIIDGKQWLGDKQISPNQPASHLDIIPTVIDILAPKGFEYVTYGQSLFEQNRLAFNQSYLLSAEKIALIADLKQYALPDALNDEKQITDLERDYASAMLAVGSKRALEGAEQKTH